MHDGDDALLLLARASGLAEARGLLGRSLHVRKGGLNPCRIRYSSVRALPWTGRKGWKTEQPPSERAVRDERHAGQNGQTYVATQYFVRYHPTRGTRLVTAASRARQLPCVAVAAANRAVRLTSSSIDAAHYRCQRIDTGTFHHGRRRR